MTDQKIYSPRTVLFIPATKPDLVEKAVSRGVEAVCFDYEDSLADEVKTAAYQNSPTFSEYANTITRLIRINSELELCVTDIEHALVKARADYIVLPKARSWEHVELIAEAIERIELRNSLDSECRLIAMIESPQALANFETHHKSAIPKLTSLFFGSEDYATCLNTTPDSPSIHAAYQRCLDVAARHQLQAYGFPGSIAEYDDLTSFKKAAEYAKSSGGYGAFAIHPKQIEVLNTIFTPDEAEILRAKEIVEHFEASADKHTGVISINGQMIDKPVYLRAKQLLG